MEKITDLELSKRIRVNLLDVLGLWASKKMQLEYQANVSISQVTAELFFQWDDFYFTD